MLRVGFRPLLTFHLRIQDSLLEEGRDFGIHLDSVQGLRFGLVRLSDFPDGGLDGLQLGEAVLDFLVELVHFELPLTMLVDGIIKGLFVHLELCKVFSGETDLFPKVAGDGQYGVESKDANGNQTYRLRAIFFANLVVAPGVHGGHVVRGGHVVLGARVGTVGILEVHRLLGDKHTLH